MSAEENKAIVLRWFGELDRGNLDVVDELIADEYVDHNPALPGLQPGREGVRQYMAILKAAFPDAVHIIEDISAEGDKVMTRVSARGTFTGECMGYEPNGNTIQISGTAIHRIENGLLMEHWAHADIAGFMAQLVADPTSVE